MIARAIKNHNKNPYSQISLKHQAHNYHTPYTAKHEQKKYTSHTHNQNKYANAYTAHNKDLKIHQNHYDLQPSRARLTSLVVPYGQMF
jgi:hypothetical protein